jgi:hypothetical protein
MQIMDVMHRRYAGIELLNEDDLAELCITLFTCMTKGEGSVLTQQQWVGTRQKFLTSIGVCDTNKLSQAVKQYEKMDTDGVCAPLCTMRCLGARPPHV